MIRSLSGRALTFCVCILVLLGAKDLRAEAIQEVTVHPDSDREVIWHEYTVDDGFNGPGGVCAADIDGDGLVDIQGAAVDGNEIAWWRNNGQFPNTWQKQTISSSFLGAIFVHAADVNGDERNDVLGAAWDGNEVAYWSNDGGDPIQWTKQTIGAATNAHEVFGHDLDQDGDTDVLAAAAGDDAVLWWRNDGGDPIQWTEQIIGQDFYGARSVCMADFDGDGDTDVAGAALASNDVKWWRNDGGDPIQWTEFTIIGNFGGAHMVRNCDMDFDGDQDIIAAGYSVNCIAWWENIGGNPLGWIRHNITTTLPGALTGYPADFDGDGDWDIVGTAQPSNRIGWWRNDGGDPWTWVEIPIDYAFGGAWPVLPHDLDGNGTADIVAGGNAVDEIRVWLNLDSWLYPDFEAIPNTGHAPLTAAFSDLSFASPQPDSWEWDLDGDGTTDSREQTPSWTYTESGSYDVSLTVGSAAGEEFILLEDYIRVFDGESALEFSGSSGHMICPASQSMAISDAVTAEAWIYPYGWGEVSGTGYGRVLDKTQFAISLHGDGPIYAGNSVLFILKDETGPPIIASTPENTMSLDAWHHVAASYDSDTGTIQMYIDGIAQSLLLTGEPEGPVRDNAEIDLYVGNNGSSGYTFHGIVDEIRLWNRQLESGEVVQGMHTYLDGTEDGLVGYWQLNEGFGDTLGDLSNYANHGYPEGAAWIQGRHVLSTHEEPSELPYVPTLQLSISPNPFRKQTSISFQLSRRSNVTLDVYDTSGKQVRSILDCDVPAGYHDLQWNGLDGHGGRLSSGTYFIRLVDDRTTHVIPCLLVK